jgi:hypothetical protein
MARVLMTDRERCTLIQMSAPADHPSVLDQNAERVPCVEELKPWLEGRGSEALPQTACLATAAADEEMLLTK